MAARIRHRTTVAAAIGAVAVIAFAGAGPDLAAQGAPAARAVATDPEVAGAKRLFTAWIEGQLAYRNLPGVVVGVVAGPDLIWAQGFGLADVASKTPMTPQTTFRMASHSKLFTATAIMQLRDQGKLHLDDPVSKHLSWFSVKPSGPDDQPITIEDLLSHASGLPREANAHWTTYEFPTAAELRNLMPERQAAFPPETRWKYSNLAYTIAGMIVEEVSGERWANYIARHIFAPLGMTSSSVDQPVPGLAVGYARRMPDGSRAVMPFVDARGMAAATGLTSNVEDMARFVSAQFPAASGAPRILSPSSLREMHRVRMLENNWSRGSGIGFAVSRERDRVLVGHGGGYPGYTTQTLIDLTDKVGVIVLTNAGDANPSGMAAELMQSVGDAAARAMAAKPATVAWDPSWSRFAGLYRSVGSDQHVVELHERLVIITPSATTLDNPIRLEPLGGGRFRYVAPVGGGPVGEVVRFVEEGGRVVRMYVGDGYLDRVTP
ncbi:MAG: serine hydrolase domain-containing protein [Acidobacteriota bacterium]